MISLILVILFSIALIIQSVFFGNNTRFTRKETIVSQLNEPRPLPTGVSEFETWADRIISGTLLTADADSMRFALCNMLLALGPTESHKPDAHFIHGLRKFAVNQVADSKRCEIRDAAKARLAVEEAALAAQAAAANPEAEATLERAKGLSLVTDKAVLGDK
jgi:hypothetical protein